MKHSPHTNKDPDAASTIILVIMPTTGKHIVFDIVGTCVGYDAFYSAIEERLGDKLRGQGIKPELFGYAWMETAERECISFDVWGRYVQFKKIFGPLLFRMLGIAWYREATRVRHRRGRGVYREQLSQAESSAGRSRMHIPTTGSRLHHRGLTSGDAERVQGYLSANGIDIAAENLVTCDSIGKTKPAPEVYKYMLDKLAGAEQVWFAAAHMWDSTAAKHNGLVQSCHGSGAYH